MFTMLYGVVAGIPGLKIETWNNQLLLVGGLPGFRLVGFVVFHPSANFAEGWGTGFLWDGE
jgi:hypothetical protein